MGQWDIWVALYFAVGMVAETCTPLDECAHVAQLSTYGACERLWYMTVVHGR